MMTSSYDFAVLVRRSLLPFISIASLLNLAWGAPVLDEIPDMEVIADERGGSFVYFSPPSRSDTRNLHVSYQFSPPSGSFFPIGKTEVVCTATNTRGETARRVFHVVVNGMQPKVVKRGNQLLFEPAPGWFAETTTSLDRGDWEPYLPADTGFAVPLPDPGPDPPQEPKLFIRLTPQRKIPGIGTGFQNGPPPDLYRYVATGLFCQAQEFRPLPTVTVWDQKGELLRTTEEDFDESGTTTLLEKGDSSDWSPVLTLPFKFYFYGLPFSRFCVNRDGLLTFDIQQANSPQSVSVTQVPTNPNKPDNPGPPIGASPPLPNPELPDYTVSCFHSPNLVPQFTDRWVVARTYGKKPHRQVWIIFHETFDVGPGPELRRSNAIVLEEGRNRVMLVDMANVIDGRYVCGVQRDAGISQQMPHTNDSNLRCRMVGNSKSGEDNDYWCFTPYRRKSLVSGDGHHWYDEDIDEAVFAAMENNNIPGISISVGMGDRMIYNKAYGFSNVEKGIEMKPWHRNPIGSCSKIFTTAGVFKLIEKGIYQESDLDAPVFTNPKILGTQPLLDGMAEGVLNLTHTASDISHFGTISMRHFMTHTARFTTSGNALQAAIDYADGDYPGVSRSQIFRWSMANRKRLPGAVGTQHTYSNSGIHLLGLAIENATGDEYIDWISANLLAPMGVEGVVVGPDHESGNTSIDSYRYTRYDGGRPHRTSEFEWGTFNQEVLREWNYSSTRLVGPPGGLIATSENVLRFLLGFNDTDHPQRPNVLPNKLRREMLSVPFKTILDEDGNPMDDPCAHTWIFDDESRVYWHNGDLPYGGSAFMGIYLDKEEGASGYDPPVFNESTVFVVVTCNSGGAGGIATSLGNSITSEIRKIASPPPLSYDLMAD